MFIEEMCILLKKLFRDTYYMCGILSDTKCDPNLNYLKYTFFINELLIVD